MSRKKYPKVDYNDAIETSTGGHAELVRYNHKGTPLVRVWERAAPFDPEPGPKGVTWYFGDDGIFAGGDDSYVRIVNSARHGDNVPEEW